MFWMTLNLVVETGENIKIETEKVKNIDECHSSHHSLSYKWEYGDHD
jgi:hypothetical protein